MSAITSMTRVGMSSSDLMYEKKADLRKLSNEMQREIAGFKSLDRITIDQLSLFKNLSEQVATNVSQKDFLLTENKFYTSAKSIIQTKYAPMFEELQKNFAELGAAPNAVTAQQIIDKADLVLAQLKDIINAKSDGKFIFGGTNRNIDLDAIFIDGAQNIDPAGAANGVNTNYLVAGVNKSSDINNVPELWAGSPMFRDLMAACYEVKRIAAGPAPGNTDINTPVVQQLMTSASNSFIAISAKQGFIDSKINQTITDIKFCEDNITRFVDIYENEIKIDEDELSQKLMSTNNQQKILVSIAQFLEKSKNQNILG